MSDLKMRIRKLLAMAESTSEHEAKTALLKARELMAQHKLSYSELAEEVGKICKRSTRHSVSKTKNYWKLTLACAIGERYCCQTITNRKRDGRLYNIGFVGFEKDVDICEEVFEFAVGFVEGKIRIMEKELREAGIDGISIRRVCNGYGEGFNSGVHHAFQEQNEHTEYGLVLVIPKEVQDAVSGYKTTTVSSSESSLNYSRYAEGYNDGMKFSPSHVLKNGRETPLPKIA